MESTKFELSPEASAELIEQFREIEKTFHELIEAIKTAVEILIEAVRKLGEQWGRMFLKHQLLEWRLPYRLADWLSRKLNWHWGWWLLRRRFNKLLKLLGAES